MLTRNFMTTLGNNYAMKLDNIPTYIYNKSGNYIGNTESSFGSSGNYPFAAQWSVSTFKIGTGTTLPKSSDFKLENEITSGYDCGTLSKRYVQGEEKDYINIYGNITNNSDSPITFSELGWFVQAGTSSVNTLLFAREVYDTPITIAPGESVAVNVNLM